MPIPSKPSYRKSGRPRTAKKLAASLRRNATPHELMLHGALIVALDGLRPNYVFQYPVGPYVADFYFGCASLVVELDGDSHDTLSALIHDGARTAFLNKRGLTVLRYRNCEVDAELPRVVREIVAKCGSVPKPGDPVKITICPPGSALHNNKHRREGGLTWEPPRKKY